MIRVISLFILLLSIHFGQSQIPKDKVLHFLGGNLYGLVGAGIANQISDGNRTWTFVGSIGGSLLIGLAKESIDRRQYDGWDNDDLLITVLGGASIGLTIDIFKKRRQRKRDNLYRDAVGNYHYHKIKKSLYSNERLNVLTVLGISSSVLYRN